MRAQFGAWFESGKFGVLLQHLHHCLVGNPRTNDGESCQQRSTNKCSTAGVDLKGYVAKQHDCKRAEGQGKQQPIDQSAEKAIHVGSKWAKTANISRCSRGEHVNERLRQGSAARRRTPVQESGRFFEVYTNNTRSERQRACQTELQSDRSPTASQSTCYREIATTGSQIKPLAKDPVSITSTG